MARGFDIAQQPLQLTKDHCTRLVQTNLQQSAENTGVDPNFKVKFRTWQDADQYVGAITKDRQLKENNFDSGQPNTRSEDLKKKQTV